MIVKKMKNNLYDKVTNINEKCEEFCKKNKQTLILDLNMDDDVKEIGNIAQIKLEDNGFGDILDLHIVSNRIDTCNLMLT
jgi:hypothetical protein